MRNKDDMESSKEKILYLITKSNWGGAQRYVFDLACEAQKRDYTPLVGCGGTGPLTEKLQKQGIRVVQIKALQRDVHFLKEIISFFDIVKLIRTEQPHVVHVNSSKAGGIGALAARINRSPCIVFTVHGLPQREKRSWLSRTLIGIATWITAVISHKIITVTRDDAEVLRRQPFLKNKIAHIQLGIEHTAISRDKAQSYITGFLDTADSRELPGDALWIGTVAELTNNKGHRYALEALNQVIKKHPQLRYVLIGSGELEKELRTYVEKNKLENHVFFTGFVPNAASLYAAFDIYLATSTKEGLPYTILEALMTGTPVIATRVGGIPDVIEHTVSGHLINPESPDEITEALLKLIENTSYRVSLGKTAQDRANRLHNKEMMATETFRLYRECAQPNRDQVSQVVR